MENKKSKADLDRNLYEYQRQLDAPKIFSEKYPNISKAVDPYLLHKDDREIFNKLGANAREVGTRDPFSWYRRAEEKASGAVAKDVYGTDSPLDLIQQLKKEDNLNYDVLLQPDEKNNGSFMPDDNRLYIDPNLTREGAIDTMIHEHGHARDFNKDPEAFINNIQPGENVRPPDAFTNGMDRWNNMYDQNDLYSLSDDISGKHFFQPRSRSINNLIEKSTQLGKQEGLSRLPDRNPKYDELNYIKPTLKELEDYTPKSQTLFDKLKKLISR